MYVLWLKWDSPGQVEGIVDKSRPVSNGDDLRDNRECESDKTESKERVEVGTLVFLNLGLASTCLGV